MSNYLVDQESTQRNELEQNAKKGDLASRVRKNAVQLHELADILDDPKTLIGNNNKSKLAKVLSDAKQLQDDIEQSRIP